MKKLELSGTEGKSPDSPERFADDLRALWQQAGQPTFGQLGKRTGRSKTSLNNATLSTSPLASADVVRALVRELDPTALDDWLARRAALTGNPDPRPTAVETESDEPGWRTSRVVAIAAAAALVGLGAGIGLSPLVRSHGTRQPANDSAIGAGTSQSPPPAAVTDGLDPAETRCVEDAEVIARREVKAVGVLELIYSADCRASWARATRAGTDGLNNQIQVTITNLRDRQQQQTALEPDVNSAYTFLLVSDDREDRMCATGKVFTKDQPKGLGPALC